MSTDINYVNEQSSEPRDDAGLPKHPSRDRRPPACFLSAVSASDVVADGQDGRRHLGEIVKVENNSLSCEELWNNTVINCNQSLSVGVDSNMPHKRQRKQQKRRHRSSDSSDSELGQHGRRGPRQQ